MRTVSHKSNVTWREAKERNRPQRLELDDGKTVHLKKGADVVQNGTRHAWRNKSTAPVTMLFFLNGPKE